MNRQDIDGKYDEKMVGEVQVRSVRSDDNKLHRAESGSSDDVVHDAVFGDIHEGGPNYRGVSNIGALIVMTKTNIGLGILSIPFVFSAIGMIPGIIVILIIQAMMTWANYVVGRTKINHPEVWGISDVGRIIGGRWGEEILSISFCLYMIFIAGSGVLSIATALNAISLHAACTAVFVAVAAVIGFLLMSIQTLQKITWLSWIGAFSIIAALITMVIAVPLQNRPAAAPPTGPWDKDLKYFAKPTFATAMGGVSSVVFSTASIPCFFAIASEMRDPSSYTKCMLGAEFLTTTLLILVGTVIYYYCGQYVAVPAPGSAGILFKRICFGLAIPGLSMSLCIFAHVLPSHVLALTTQMAAKYIFVRTLRGTKHLSSNTKRHWITWFACTGSVAIISYIIASAIPIFSSLVSLIGALFGTIVSVMPMGLMWLHDNYYHNPNRTWKIKLQAVWAGLMVVGGAFITIGGTYGAIVAMVNDGSKGRPWSCADNSV